MLTASFSGTPVIGVAPLSVSFTDLSTPGPSGPITAWNWDFGDGHSSAAQNPTHNYTTDGIYTVTLTVTGTSPDGTASDIAVHYVAVAAPPTTIYAAHKTATSNLYTVNPATGAMTSIGPIGSGMSGMAVDPTNGHLYGVTSGASSDPDSLYLINTSTGAGTRVGAAFSLGTQMHDIAFDPDGQLWGVDTSGDLYSIDKTTGVATEIGGTSGSYSGGFDFDSGGQGWRVGDRNPSGGTAQTATIDLTSGDVTHVADMSDGNFLHSGKFGDRSVFWAGSPGQTSPGAQNLVIVNPATGAVAVIAAFGTPSNVGGMALVFTPSSDFSVRLVPSTIYVSDGISTLVYLNTKTQGGDTETITLSATAPPGFTVTFPDNPITAGDIDVPINIAVGSPSLGTDTITIHCVGTANSHDVVLTANVVTIVPGVHLAS